MKKKNNQVSGRAVLRGVDGGEIEWQYTKQGRG